MTNPDVDSVVAGLSEGEREALARLSGAWGRTGCGRSQGVRAGKILNSLSPGLVERKFAGDCHRYRLTPLGLAVRARLAAQEGE